MSDDLPPPATSTEADRALGMGVYHEIRLREAILQFTGGLRNPAVAARRRIAPSKPKDIEQQLWLLIHARWVDCYDWAYIVKNTKAAIRRIVQLRADWLAPPVRAAIIKHGVAEAVAMVDRAALDVRVGLRDLRAKGLSAYPMERMPLNVMHERDLVTVGL